MQISWISIILPDASSTKISSTDLLLANIYLNIGISLLLVQQAVGRPTWLGEGELVLTSFLVIIQGMLEYRKKECIKKKKIYKIYYYYFLWLITILELVAYVTLKVNTENNRWVVVGVSILCTIASIGMSWQGKKLLMGGAD